MHLMCSQQSATVFDVANNFPTKVVAFSSEKLITDFGNEWEDEQIL